MKTHRGRRRLLGLAIAALLVSPFSSVRAADQTVYERGVEFDEPQVKVFVGETVTWVYVSSPSNSGHTVTFEDDSLNDERFDNCPALVLDDCQRSPSDRIVRTFPRQGPFPYYCKIHGGPGGRGMAGVVVVTPVSTPSTTVPTTTSTTVRATTTTTRATTSTTTSTTRPLATSSTLASSTTTTPPDTSSVLLPGDPPPFSADDINSSAAGRSGGPDNGSDTTTVALIVALLLAVSAGGGYLLWRLRPGRA